MSNIELVIEERAASIGDFLVGRLLPFRQKRMVGPFIFIDHMGPVTLGEDSGFDVDPHPHIGLSTLTYLFEGEIHHRDSLGTSQVITPGDVNWMTAGKGVVHSERLPEDMHTRHPNAVMHGLQIWVALPKEKQEIEPSFVHIDQSQLPTWTEQGADFKLIAGAALGKQSPVPVYSPLYFIEIKAKDRQRIAIGDGLYGESALYILEGQVVVDEHVYDPKQILVAKNSKLCTFEMMPGTSVYIFGGEAMPEPRHILWNFVSDDIDKLAVAKQQWLDQDLDVFPAIPGEEGQFIPFPVGMGSFKNKN